MKQITEEKQSRLVARPLRETARSLDRNIFSSINSTERLPSLQTIKGKSYHAVGPQTLRERIIETQEREAKTKEQPLNFNQTGFSNSLMNTTNINRQTILSKINKEQVHAVTRQTRQLDRYREYKTFWDHESNRIKKLSGKGKKGNSTLLQKNVKGLYVQENQDRMDIINNYVVNYWEMSLRNNNKILHRHTKGHKYDEVQFEKLWQTEKGVKTVERSIPVLPLDKLRQTKGQELSISGRNKAMSETFKSGFSTQKQTTPGHEEVYKISYTGNEKWMSTEGL